MIAQLAGDLARELLKAHAIILGMLKVMPSEQRLALHGVLDAVGCYGSLRCITRIDARRAALARAGYHLDQDDQIIAQPTTPPVGNWCVKYLAGVLPFPMYYSADDEESSEPRFVFRKEEAQRFALAEAETFVAVLRASGWRGVEMVSAGGQS